jgi:hypothetical protein
MPKFVIERQYLVPMYQHIIVEAETLEEACNKGVIDDIDWDTQENGQRQRSRDNHHRSEDRF